MATLTFNELINVLIVFINHFSGLTEDSNPEPRNPLALKSKKVQGTFGVTFILALLSSAVFHLQKLVSDFL